MNKYKKVTKEEVLEMFYDLQTKFWKAGCWAERISTEFLAHKMGTSTYQIRKAYKQLAEEGYSFYDEFKIFVVLCAGTCKEINLMELQAINKKCQEMGWIK